MQYKICSNFLRHRIAPVVLVVGPGSEVLEASGNASSAPSGILLAFGAAAIAIFASQMWNSSPKKADFQGVVNRGAPSP